MFKALNEVLALIKNRLFDNIKQGCVEGFNLQHNQILS